MSLQFASFRLGCDYRYMLVSKDNCREYCGGIRRIAFVRTRAVNHYWITPQPSLALPGLQRYRIAVWRRWARGGHRRSSPLQNTSVAHRSKVPRHFPRHRGLQRSALATPCGFPSCTICAKPQATQVPRARRNYPLPGQGNVQRATCNFKRVLLEVGCF